MIVKKVTVYVVITNSSSSLSLNIMLKHSDYLLYNVYNDNDKDNDNDNDNDKCFIKHKCIQWFS